MTMTIQPISIPVLFATPCASTSHGARPSRARTISASVKPNSNRPTNSCTTRATTRLDQTGCPARAFGGGPYRTRGKVVVDDAAGLHQCIKGCRAEEANASALEFARKRSGLGRRRRYVIPRHRWPASRCTCTRAQDGAERFTAGAKLHDGARVSDSRLDLRPIAHEAGILKQACDVRCIE